MSDAAFDRNEFRQRICSVENARDGGRGHYFSNELAPVGSVFRSENTSYRRSCHSACHRLLPCDYFAKTVDKEATKARQAGLELEHLVLLTPTTHACHRLISQARCLRA